MKEFEKFVENFVATYKPLYAEAAKAYYVASITGDDKDYEQSAKLEVELTKILADKDKFAELKKAGADEAEFTLIEKRQYKDLYNSYLSHQIDQDKLEAMINLQTEIEKKFATFRAKLKDKDLTDNEVEEILERSTDAEELKQVWLSSKEVGKTVASDVVRLVKLRNEAAREVGFSNFHEMSLKLDEQDPLEIEKIFDELDQLTGSAFAEVKHGADQFLADRLGITADDLMPWHYQNRFFQEAPKIYPVNFDKYYGGKDPVELTRRYFEGISMPVDDILARSDLYEKPGKNQHAYCMDVDREGDIRVLCNVKSNLKWMDTMLHELGHAVYDKFADPTLPWLLRTAAHTFTTEAIAIFFGALASNADWLKANLGISNEESNTIQDAATKQLRLEKLIFSRWSQVVYRFEKSMYEDPDQNLNQLWWQLVEKYQMVKRPEGRDEPDWASKIHLATVPAYYHNYLLGTVLASQIKSFLLDKVHAPASFTGSKEMGEWLISNIFSPGARYHWDDMIERATGEKLTVKYFTDEFVG